LRLVPHPAMPAAREGNESEINAHSQMCNGPGQMPLGSLQGGCSTLPHTRVSRLRRLALGFVAPPALIIAGLGSSSSAAVAAATSDSDAVSASVAVQGDRYQAHRRIAGRIVDGFATIDGSLSSGGRPATQLRILSGNFRGLHLLEVPPVADPETYCLQAWHLSKQAMAASREFDRGRTLSGSLTYVKLKTSTGPFMDTVNDALGTNFQMQ